MSRNRRLVKPLCQHLRFQPRLSTRRFGRAGCKGPYRPQLRKGSPNHNIQAKRKFSQTYYPDDLRVAFIDKADPNGQNQRKSMAAHRRPSKEIVFLAERGPPLTKGVKVICCDNEESNNIGITTVVGVSELWKGSELAANISDNEAADKLARHRFESIDIRVGNSINPFCGISTERCMSITQGN